MRFAIFGLITVALSACAVHHEARLAPRALPPPPVDMVPHTGKLWIALDDQTRDHQCQTPPNRRTICFAKVRQTLGQSLERTLWPSFPRVSVKHKGDNIDAHDYILLVRLDVEALPSDETGPGWSAGARGSWELIRDGIPLAGESVSSRSRADFPYGATLASGASDAVDAISVHIASVVGQLPETQPLSGIPLPAVAVGKRIGPLFGGMKPPCATPRAQSSDDASRCSMASR